MGTSALYASVKARHPGDDNYPTQRFVRAWLRRQASNQVYQRPLRQRSDIQAVITSRPNELIQVDYMYFYRHLTGEPVIDEDEMTPEEREKFKADRDANVPGLGQARWPKGSFARKFTKDELLRVPKDEKDRPIAQKKSLL